MSCLVFGIAASCSNGAGHYPKTGLSGYIPAFEARADHQLKAFETCRPHTRIPMNGVP
ncbi:hypothetical protein BDBG_00206 [Blastomyces gilchristii SLH14081]|uniref:Uncharacterized protein n=1 Tax=Blastomyces gilchristii (strain SLH14081) TaxID=559298 RepID=A0A179U667_BLAGS|nr:uncharacterized protein BDBG_00206 [Blastomyces gilchristii SLH14081]OAT03495.1 hypothetical protein BDBG_00206 [Blastomyces gilchristii SLH14081]